MLNKFLNTFADSYQVGQDTLIQSDILKFKSLSKSILNSTSKRTGLSLFHYFIINCHEFNLDYSQVIDTFLNSGININSQADKAHGHYSALHFAVGYKENFELVKILIEKRIDINLRDEYGNTAFWNACHNYRGLDVQREIIEYLFHNGASIDDTNNSGISVRKIILELAESTDSGYNPKEWDLRVLKINL